MIDVDTLESTGEEGNSKDWEYTKLESVTPYKFVEDLYYEKGGFGYSAGGSTYLIPHTREYFFDKRVENSGLRNYLKPIIDAMVSSVFYQDIDRQTLNKLFQRFLEDVTGGGLGIDQFSRASAIYGRIFGFCAIVMDNFSRLPEDMPEGEVLDDRKIPYCYFRKPDSINYDHTETDQFGNLIEITFAERDEIVDGKEKTIYKKWTANEWIEFYQEKDKIIILDQGEHGLGVLPVKLYYYGDKVNPTDISVLPPLLGIAKMNFVLYNVDSQNRQWAADQRFGIFFVQGVKSSSLLVGTKSCINLPDEVSISPGYVSPDMQIGTDGREETKDIIDSIYQLAQQNGVSGVTDASSGVAKQWDFFAQESQLKKTAYITKEIEEWMAEIFGLYVGQSIDYDVKYPEDFQPNNVSEQIDAIDKALLTGTQTPTARAVLGKYIFDLITRGDDSEDAKKARAEFSELADAEINGERRSEEEG